MSSRTRFVTVVPFAVLFAITTTLAQTKPDQRASELMDRGIEYLKSQQKPDGGWQGDREPPGMTAIVLRAVLSDPPLSLWIWKIGRTMCVAWLLDIAAR